MLKFRTRLTRAPVNKRSILKGLIVGGFLLLVAGLLLLVSVGAAILSLLPLAFGFALLLDSSAIFGLSEPDLLSPILRKVAYLGLATFNVGLPLGIVAIYGSTYSSLYPLCAGDLRDWNRDAFIHRKSHPSRSRMVVAISEPTESPIEYLTVSNYNRTGYAIHRVHCGSAGENHPHAGL